MKDIIPYNSLNVGHEEEIKLDSQLADLGNFVEDDAGLQDRKSYRIKYYKHSNLGL